MYKNYGDFRFFEHGRLVDAEHSDTVFSVLYCEPYPDEEDLYQFAVLTVDVGDSFIDTEAVIKASGLKLPCKPVDMALGAVDYYCPECFGACDMGSFGVDWLRMGREDIMGFLEGCLIAADEVSFEA